MAGQIKPSADNQSTGCLVLFGIIVALVLIGKCSSSTSPSSDSNKAGLYDDNRSMADVNTAAPSAPPPLQPLDGLSAKVGFRHFRLANGAEGSAGDMIYSQNCYEALGRSFSWSRLDTCGAFDMAAADAVEEDASATSEQSAYFEPETAAGRYLAAATGAGEPADDADRRLAALQRLRPKHAPPAAVAATTEGAEEGPDSPAADLNATINPPAEVNL